MKKLLSVFLIFFTLIIFISCDDSGDDDDDDYDNTIRLQTILGSNIVSAQVNDVVVTHFGGIRIEPGIHIFWCDYGTDTRGEEYEIRENHDDWYVYFSNVEIRLSEVFNFTTTMTVSFGGSVTQAKVDGTPVSHSQSQTLFCGIHNFWCVSNSYPLPEGYEEDIEVTEEHEGGSIVFGSTDIYLDPLY